MEMGPRVLDSNNSTKFERNNPERSGRVSHCEGELILNYTTNSGVIFAFFSHLDWWLLLLVQVIVVVVVLLPGVC